MSGLEIAGTVLAIIPICIKLAEGCISAQEKAQRFKTWKGRLASCVATLTRQQQALRQTIQIMLLPILPRQTINNMLNDPQGDDWCEELLIDKFKQHHTATYDYFLQTIRELHELTMELLVEFGLDITPDVGFLFIWSCWCSQ